MATVKLVNVNKVYDSGVHAVHDFNISIEDKEFMGQIQIPDVVGFCLVRNSGEVEYYRKREKSGI